MSASARQPPPAAALLSSPPTHTHTSNPPLNTPLLAGMNGVKASPKGLAIAPLGGWGNTRYAANAALMVAIHAKYTPDAATRAAWLAWVEKQIQYMLGLAGSDRCKG